eukprot:c48408_g1_i1 orf=3-164(-)
MVSYSKCNGVSAVHHICIFNIFQFPLGLSPDAYSTYQHILILSLKDDTVSLGKF